MSSTAESICVAPSSEAADGAAPDGRPHQQPLRRRGLTGMLQIIAIVAAVALAVAFSREDSPPPTATAAAVPGATDPAAQTAQLVRVLAPEPTATRISIAATGAVEVRSLIELTPQVGGQVVTVAPSLRSGGKFSAGEVLFRIDPRDFELTLDQARAEVAAAESRLELRLAEADAARANYALLHGNAPVPPLVAKVPQIDQSRADVAAAEARVARAELDLTRTAFSLPFEGRITETTVAVGQQLADGRSYGRAFPVDAIEVRVPLSQDDLARLEPAAGRSAVVTVAGRSYDAVVDRAAATLDERTRFASLYLTLEEAAGLAPGSFADVMLYGAQLTGAYILPEAAEQAGSGLWLVDQGALKRFTPTIHGRTERGLILEPFNYGEGIVLGNVPGAREGMPVTTEAIAPGSGANSANSGIGG